MCRRPAGAEVRRMCAGGSQKEALCRVRTKLLSRHLGSLKEEDKAEEREMMSS